MSSKFVISHLEVQMGPFDEAELKAKWAKGDLLPIDYVYDDVKQDWVLLSERFAWAKDVRELEPEAPPDPPPISEAASRRHRSLTTRAKPELKTQSPESEASPAAVAPTPVEVTPVAVLTPSPTAAPAPLMTLAHTKSGAEVVLVNGEGELEIPAQQPGEVELKVQNSPLQLASPLKIHIRTAEPQVIEWNVPSQQTVGEDVEVLVQALDGANRLCSSYDDTFTMRVGGADGLQFSVVLKHGQALLRIQHTKAETWNLSLLYSGQRSLKLPSEQTLEWQPGPAVKLILDGPAQYSAGHPLKVSVRAVDRFGNLAKSYQGTLVLEVVKAS